MQGGSGGVRREQYAVQWSAMALAASAFIPARTHVPPFLSRINRDIAARYHVILTSSKTTLARTHSRNLA